MKNVMITLSFLFLAACSQSGFEVNSIKPINENTGDTGDTGEKVSLTFSTVQEAENSTNTIQNNVSFKDAKILVKEVYVSIYEYGNVKVSGLFQTLTPSTVKGFALKDEDFGNIKDWIISNNNNGKEYTLYSKKLIKDVSQDGQVRQVEIQLRFTHNYLTQTYSYIAILGHMVDGPFVGTTDTGNETYGAFLY